MYYIILDRYASDETLREIYGYDNTPMLSELEERGFVIARQSWADKAGTPRAASAPPAAAAPAQA